jgi:uncharacterized repeat protein (TIGR01451 family)
MKRLLVRASALAGLLALAVFAVVQTHRAQPTASAQERPTTPSGIKKRAKAKPSSTGRKPKSAAKKKPMETAAPEPYADRYADRYEDAGAADATGTNSAPVRINADFDGSDLGTEVPNAGPDLFPESNEVDLSAARLEAGRDPFNKSMTPDDADDVALPAVESVMAPERPSVYAPGSVRQAAKPRATKRPAAATNRKKPLRAGANQPSAGAARYSQPPSDVFGPEPSDSAAAPIAVVPATAPRRDPFGDAAPISAATHRQPVVGHGRPGLKQLEGEQSPTLVVEKVAPEEIQVGKPAIFAVRVRNTGTVAAQGVEIHDTIPQGTHLLDTHPAASGVVEGRVTWTVGAIKPGDEVTVEMELMPMAEGEVGSVATVHFAGEASARTRCTRPQLAVEVSAPGEVLMGEEVTFSIKISNPGTGTATGIVLSEAIPEQLEHPSGSELEYEVGDLKPGESRQIELTMNTVKAGAVVNTLTARGEGQLQAEQQLAFTVVAPQLEVSMQGPKRRYLERQATYTVTVSNPGTAAAKEIQLVTHLPKGLKFVGANNAGEFDPVTNSVHWMLDELPAKEAGQVTLTTLPIEAGEQMLKVEGVAQSGLSAEQEEVVSVEGVAAILFQLEDLADPIEVGGETNYEIHVVNQGSKAATNVQLVAVFPPQLKPRSAHGPTRDAIVGQEVRFQPLARLAPKGETTYQIRAQGLEPGDLRVQVQLLTDEMQTPVTKEESTRVYADE